MFFSKLKIATKLIISSAVFLIPIGVMFIFVYTMSTNMIQKSMDESNGITTLKPVVTVMRNLPEYLNVYLGLEQGNPRTFDDQINNAIVTLNNELRRYRLEGRGIPNLAIEWEALKNADKDDEELYQRYLDFTYSLINMITIIGEESGLLLVSDMNTYYFISPALSGIPEAYLRLITIGNLLRKNLYEAEEIVERWNNDLLASQEQGRRLSARPYEGNPLNIPMNMMLSSDTQLIRNSRLLFESDVNKISGSLTSAIQESSHRIGSFDRMSANIDQYTETFNIMSAQYGRMIGFGVTNPTTAAEFFNTISRMSTALYQLWDESLSQLDIQVKNNASNAQRNLILYLLLILVTLGIAIWFVLFIRKDISRSVKNLDTLFKGLKEKDLTLSLEITSQDEFGTLMKAFNGFIHLLRSTFGSFKQSTQLVANSVFDLSSSSKEITTTANEQSASVSEIVSTMESSKNLSEQIALKTTEVAQLAIETQELSSKGADLREANQNMMEDIRSQNQKIISEIRNLSDMIVRISEAIRIIDSIADQTKLIAFNASLEASSSSDSGTRFSVVASEIRRFADNVAGSTREIKKRIEEVQSASQMLISEANNGSRQIEIGYERMGEQKIVFEHIVENSQNVATRSQQISNLSKQQELASSQIFITLKEISAGVKQFVIATSSTSKIADSLSGMAEKLKEKVEKFRTEI